MIPIPIITPAMISIDREIEEKIILLNWIIKLYSADRKISDIPGKRQPIAMITILAHKTGITWNNSHF